MALTFVDSCFLERSHDALTPVADNKSNWSKTPAWRACKCTTTGCSAAAPAATVLFKSIDLSLQRSLVPGDQRPPFRPQVLLADRSFRVRSSLPFGARRTLRGEIGSLGDQLIQSSGSLSSSSSESSSSELMGRGFE